MWSVQFFAFTLENFIPDTFFYTGNSRGARHIYGRYGYLLGNYLFGPAWEMVEAQNTEEAQEGRDIQKAWEA